MISTRRLALLLPATAMAFAGPAVSHDAANQPDVINLGRSKQGEPCLATRRFNDPAAPDAFAVSYYITCRDVSASRPVGVIRIVNADAIGAVDATMTCGAASAVTIAAGSGTARNCYDSALAAETVRVDLPAGGGKVMVGSAGINVLGPFEQALAVFSGRMRPAAAEDGTLAATLSPDKFAAAPARTAGTGTEAAFDVTGALAVGLDYNQKGQNVDASRVLNDALSRLPADTPVETRAQLQLEAGLADSNISFDESAQEHFTAADALIAQAGPDARPDLERKRDAYRALDLLNRRRFPQALAALNRLDAQTESIGGPLADANNLRVLNQTPRATVDASSAVAAPDVQALSRDMLNAQTEWAKSVAMFALGDEAGSRTAIDEAARTYGALATERVDQGQVLWLGARIERQRGRLAARAGDLAGAEAAFDRAIDLLRRGSLASAGTGTEPAIAEVQLERASIIAQASPGSDRARTEYATAVDALIASNASGGGLPYGIEGYYDLLIAEADAPRDDTYERFFRAMQATGEPAVARQLTQLQSVIGADPALAALLRDKADEEREITRLRYAIAEPGAGGTAEATAALEGQRLAAEQRLAGIEAKINANPSYQAIDDEPATLAEIRAALRPGEGYYKLTELGRRAYGLFATADRTYIFPIAKSAKDVRDLNALGAAVRASIDGQVATRGKLVSFAEGPAYALYRLIAGPAADAIKATKALVVDPAGPLSNLPIGVLVTSFDPKAKRSASFDYSRTAFLARETTISTAVSPRSFLVVRGLPGSDAPRPFLGLGEHQRPGQVAEARNVSVGFGCSVPYAELAKLSNEFEPISAKELAIASTALGQPGAPQITDAAFSDTDVIAKGGEGGELQQYQVLHFATHGLEEGVWGCAKSPPALVTSFGDADSDGLLSFSEIARLKLNANLVVLSACDTASGVKNEALARSSGQEEAGSTLEGLVRAFLAARARAVLATYWQVSAEAESEDFIRTFYGAARSTTIGGALQAAQRELIERPDYSHPFYWAPYFVVGDSTKPMLSTPASPPLPTPNATGN